MDEVEFFWNDEPIDDAEEFEKNNTKDADFDPCAGACGPDVCPYFSTDCIG